MKRIIAFLLLCSSAFGANYAEHSAFTAAQISEHLGIFGGNWSVDFDEKIYLGFIVRIVSAEGQEAVKFHWSKNPSKEHTLYMMQFFSEKNEDTMDFRIQFSSMQKSDEITQDESGFTSTQSLGYGLSYADVVPCDVTSKQEVRSTAFRAEPESVVALYSWSSDETLQKFSLEVVFTTDPTQAEQDATPNSGTASLRE